MTLRNCAWIAAALLVLLPAKATAQTLRRASDAVHTGSSVRRPARTSSHPSSTSSSSSHSSGRQQRYSARHFLPHPYAWGQVGYGHYDPSHEEPTEAAPRATRRVAAVTSLDGGLALPNIGRGAVGLRVLGSAYEFEVRYSFFAEPEAAQIFWVGLGRFRGGVVLADAADLRLRVFGGLVHWVDSGGSEFGGEGGLGLDVFPGAPWVLSFDLSGGYVARAWLIGLRGAVGYMVGPVEFQLGWQHESVIPTVDGGTVDLSGPLAGVRLWL